MTIGKAAPPRVLSVPQGIERAALGIPELLKGGWPTNGGGIETCGAAFIRMCIQAAVEVDIPGTQTQSTQDDNPKQGIHHLWCRL